MGVEVYCDIMTRDIRALMVKVGCSERFVIPQQVNIVAHNIASEHVFISIKHKSEHVTHFLKHKQVLLSFTFLSNKINNNNKKGWVHF